MDVLSAVGICALVLWSYDTFKSLVGICWGLCKQQWTVGCDYVQRYGKWAVITGGSDGIGRQYAMFFARQGLNIVIIAMPDEKLAKTVQEIEEKFKVQVRSIPVDFSKAYEVYNYLKEKIADLEIGVLVNNVGTGQCYATYFEADSIDGHQRVVNVNINAVVMMSHIVLPQMKQRLRGLVINISSAFGLTPVPTVLIYGASKAFMLSFSLAMREELRPFGVECQTVTPYFVKTTLTGQFAMTKLGWLVCANLESFTKFLTMTIGKTAQTTGYWVHGWHVTIVKLLPTDLVCRMYHLLGKFRINENKLKGK
ncbi:very-long-chain 3-oxoacyl-CoA reductase-like [Ochlerotatus camptorhynchus]|uniref:very-long-chain 3-oxoacyl-CoA reductase-like n=1 Tax=Ochlerotatus camptorhynchus TaxID=644619 RepID=UPI0031D67198